MKRGGCVSWHHDLCRETGGRKQGLAQTGWHLLPPHLFNLPYNQVSSRERLPSGLEISGVVT